MKKVLVTGGNGFIGRYVCETLEKSDIEPVVLDHRAQSAARRETVLGDIRDATAVTEAMAHVDGFIHLAGVLGTQETITNPRPAAETNILGGLNVLEASTQYDVPGVNIAVGNYWMQNTYSITKDTVSRFTEMYRVERGARVSTMRALNAYGPRQSVAAPYGSSKVRKIMPSFVMRALYGHPIEVYGDGSQIMDMIYVQDVATLLVRALERTADKGGSKIVYSAGTGRPTTVLEIAEIVSAEVKAQTGTAPKITHLPMRAGEPEQSVVLGDPSTLRELDVIDERDFTVLEDGVKSTVEHYIRDYHPR